MNKFLNKLPLLAFVLAAFAALAFNFPNREVTAEYGKHNGEVYDVTNVDMGPAADEYWCNELSVTCLYQNEAATIPVPDSQGQFIPGSGLDPIE